MREGIQVSATKALRDAADAACLSWTAGYLMRDGRRVDEGTVTTLWPVPGDAGQSLTFEEEDGELWCADSVAPAQCVAAVRVAKAPAVIVGDGETDCATGHCECGWCGKPIDPWDKYCRHCGVEVEG